VQELVSPKAPLVTPQHVIRELRPAVRSGVHACLALILVMQGIACGGDSHAPTGPPDNQDCTSPGCNVSSVTVSPAPASVYEGLSIQFRATARDASGQIVTGVTFQWVVSDSAVAEIDASGRLTGKEAGIVQVRAIANGKVGSVDLVVIDATVASLEIVAPSSLLVNESALFKVIVRNADGAEVPTPPQLQWASSDEAIARVDFGRAPVVTALRRGTVAIHVSAGGVDASVSLSVRARVAIGRQPFPGHFTAVDMAIGEDLQFAALFVDVNGETIEEAPSVTWASRNPHVASVSSTGRVTSLQTGESTITARNSEGVGTIEVFVTDIVAGLPAKARIAHAAGGNGPLTFVTSQGASVTLDLGESVEVPIVSGTLMVRVDGLRSIEPWITQSEMSLLVRGGDNLQVFGTSSGLTGRWIRETSVPADSGLVSFVQGSGPPNFAIVVFLGAPGATAGRLIHCYFDPYEITNHVGVPAGEFDVIMGDKGLFFDPSSASERARGRITVAPGRAVTYVIAGESPQTMRLLAFPDF
jgi:hypothetical protein